MKVETVINKQGQKVYNVEDDGCIQEFFHKKEAQGYVDYVNEMNWRAANNKLSTFREVNNDTKSSSRDRS